MRIVFRYENRPTNNLWGADGSSDAITLFASGVIWYEHYLFRCDTPSETKVFGPFPTVVTQVEEIIARYAKEIEHFPDFIDNNCCDGNWQYFQLGEKQFVVDNMQYHSEEDIYTVRFFYESDQVNEIMLRVRQTNTAVEIYHKIMAVIEGCCDCVHLLI